MKARITAIVLGAGLAAVLLGVILGGRLAAILGGRLAAVLVQFWLQYRLQYWVEDLLSSFLGILRERKRSFWETETRSRNGSSFRQRKLVQGNGKPV